MGINYNLYKPVRNRFRKYDKETLLFSLLKLSRDISVKEPISWPKSGYIPWEIFTLVKWILNDWNNIDGKKLLDKNEIHKVLNSMKQIQENIELDKVFKKENNFKLQQFSRRTALQQFWYQSKINKSKVSKSISLLVNNPKFLSLNKAFQENTGLDMKSFFDLTFLCWFAFTIDETRYLIEIETISTIVNDIDNKKILNYFNYLSLDYYDLDTHSSKIEISDYFLDIFGKTDLLYKPFVKKDDKYYLWSVRFLEVILEFGLYDILKSINSDKLGNVFGPTFDKHVQSLLAKRNIRFISEKEQKKLGLSKQVDAIVDEERHNFYIEFKGIEASKKSSITPTQYVMLNSYDNHLIKALKQIFSVNSEYSKKSKTNFAFIVTYKDLYIGTVDEAWKEFIHLDYKLKYYNMGIQLENIFVLSLNCFEKLLKVASIVGDFSTVLEKIDKFIGEDTRNRRYIFTMYLEELFKEELIKIEEYPLYEEYLREITHKYFSH
ncbi:MAG: hypothetical protein CME62_14855 [Halobacteriovoraceae bacterium]|nr:hypothetical protein [Halobacteriovoraceae bacterium]